MRIWGGLSVRLWSREVSRLLTGIKQTPQDEGFPEQGPLAGSSLALSQSAFLQRARPGLRTQVASR